MRGAAVRPSGDRVRETLFNWLAPRVPGARCLDWFAGSGVLGIEALSRGAARCVLVERDAATCAALRVCLTELGADAAGAVEVLQADATRAALRPLGPFDIVFVDPPFDGPDIGNLCTLLERSGALAAGGLVYLEMRRAAPPPALPAQWAVLRDKTAGQVRFMLAERSTAPILE